MSHIDGAAPKEVTRKDITIICDLFDQLEVAVESCISIFLELTEDEKERYDDEADQYKRLADVTDHTKKHVTGLMLRLLGQWQQAVDLTSDSKKKQ